MTRYKIPQQRLNFVGNLGLSFKGSVEVDYPKAQIEIPASATLCKDYTYILKLDPERGKWSNQDSHSWTAANIKVTVRAKINRSTMKEVLVEVVDSKGKRHWSDVFNLYGPYKVRVVEAYAQPAFISPIKENADHTYGIGYDDTHTRKYLWACGGDHDGDKHRKIGEGKAFEPECDCLSQRIVDPVTKGLAGIRYGVDGVCHQATNRLLCPACIEVKDALGYKSKGWKYLTYVLYGRLGIRLNDSREKWEGIKKGCLTRTYDFCTEAPLSTGYELEVPTLTKEEIETVQSSAATLQSHFLDAYTRLEQQLLTPTEYAEKLNGEINTFVSEMSGPLSEETHSSLFEGISGKDIVLVEPQICEVVFSRNAGKNE